MTELIIISGRSGSGKTAALHALEDLGYYAIDNLPLSALHYVLDSTEEISPLAISLDARNLPTHADAAMQALHQLRQAVPRLELLFLDADDDILTRRFQETRRRHPLSRQNMTLREAIAAEQRLLHPLYEMATLSLNTASLSLPDLYQIIKNHIRPNQASPLVIRLLSFGFKHGLPEDADFVFDARLLPNPFWLPELRQKTGQDAEVKAFFEQQHQARSLLQSMQTFLSGWMEGLGADRRCQLTIAIGCTGGQHRSVYLVEEMSKLLAEGGAEVQAWHRELSKINRKEKQR